MNPPEAPEPREILEALRAAVREGTGLTPPERLALAQSEDPALLRTAGRILNGFDPRDADLPRIAIRVVATSGAGGFPALLRSALVSAGLLPRIETREFGAFDASLAADGDPFEWPRPPDARPGLPAVPAVPATVVCLADDAFFAGEGWPGTGADGLLARIDERWDYFRGLLDACLDRTSATVMLHTIPLTGPLRDGVIGWRERTRLTSRWHRLNAELLDLAGQKPRVMVADLAGILADTPTAARDDRLFRYAGVAYSDAALLELARQVRRAVQARFGRSRKALALDLDGTLWGGTLGEDGIGGVQVGAGYPGNSYLALQHAARGLRDQGVALVLSSKNESDEVAEALAGHPDVVLRPELFSVIAADWAPKAANLRLASTELGLPADSLVFMDDSPAERAQVRADLPDVAIIPADGDPAALARRLLRDGWFDAVQLTDADRLRGELYRSRRLRAQARRAYSSSAEFLRTLGITMRVESADVSRAARVAQLSVRTHQFNLTGVPVDEAALSAMSRSGHHLVRAFRVKDRFGDEGIVGAAWADTGTRRWDVRNLVLSCRVLGRGVELAMIGWLVERAREAGAELVVGRYVPTGRNAPAADAWRNAGFLPAGPPDAPWFEFRPGPRPYSAAPDWITVTDEESP